MELEGRVQEDPGYDHELTVREDEIVQVVSRLVQDANRRLPQDVMQAIMAAREQETSSIACLILDLLIENARIADETGLPCCQDTGIDVVFIRLGSRLRIRGDIHNAVNQGIALGTGAGYLRTSVCDPLTRKNSGDNTPAVIHLDIVPDSDELSLTLLPKGCGSENMSGLIMLPPSAGVQGIKDFVLAQILKAGPNPCPPGIIGVGIGGTMERAALLAKQALLRPCGQSNQRKDLAALEQELLTAINSTGVGPVGLGGRTSALFVAVEAWPCHIASLPVAVNIQCHAARRAEAVREQGKWRFNSGEPSFPVTGREIELTRDAKRLELPLKRDVVNSLKAGEWVLLNGTLFTGRDQTHRVLSELVRQGKELPVDLKDQLIYYVGPTPAPPGKVIGSAGPTTSYRMDAYTREILSCGVRGLMGKGRRSPEVRSALQEAGAIYLATVGGAGAYLAGTVEDARVVAFPELGPEAMFELQVRDFPAIVINDLAGRDYYEEVLSQRE